MLILTRKSGEKIRIGDDIVVMITGVNGNQVKVGVDAPREVEVHRQEIYEQIQEDKNGTA